MKTVQIRVRKPTFTGDMTGSPRADGTVLVSQEHLDGGVCDGAVGRGLPTGGRFHLTALAGQSEGVVGTTEVFRRFYQQVKGSET